MRWLCYSLPKQLVWFISGEMGSKDRLTALQAVAVEPNDPRLEQCPEIPAQFLPAEFPFGWLGSPIESISSVLGPPSGVVGKERLYFYLGSIEVKSLPRNSHGESQIFDVLAFARMQFSDDNLSSISVSHITSF